MAFNQCYILKKSVICSSRYTITPISLFSQQILGARLYKDLRLNDQYKVIIFMKFVSDVSKDIILLVQQEPFLMVTRLHIPA